MSALTNPTKIRVGNKIRRARLETTPRLSHDAIAKQVGTSRQHLIMLEKGLHLPSRELLQRIAEATGQPLEFFTADDDEEDRLPSLTFMLETIVDDRVDRALNRAGLDA